MKLIPLTQGMYTLVDNIDYEYLSQFKWHANKTPFGSYYARGRINGVAIYMHTVIAKRSGVKHYEDVDHVNGITLDNQRSNLRPATHQQNMRNMRKEVRSASGVRGVHRNKDRWIARLTVDGKGLCFGTYDTIEEAAQARRAAEIKYFSEFAPGDSEQ